MTSFLGTASLGRSGFHAICASGSLELIRIAEAAEDKRLLSLYPDGLGSYLEEQVKGGGEICPHDRTLIKLTRLHNENLYLCLIQMAIGALHGEGGRDKAKRVLKHVPQLNSVFLCLLWDRLFQEGHSGGLSLQDLEQVFEDFKPHGAADAPNTVDKIWGILRHRILISSMLSGRGSRGKGGEGNGDGDGDGARPDPIPQLREVNTRSIAQVLSESGAGLDEAMLALAESLPTFNDRQKVLLSHDLNMFHVQGFIFTFFKAFSLTNICFADPEAQWKELQDLLATMRTHVKKTTCSFTLSWMAWFCYVFFNCRYHENVSNWRSVGSEYFKSEMKGFAFASGKEESRGTASNYAVELFDSVLSLIEESASSPVSLDEDYVGYVHFSPLSLLSLSLSPSLIFVERS